MKITEALSNPVRVRIVQYMQLHDGTTTKKISEALGDIPAPTLYRHIDFLLKENILTVTEERRIRGSSERVLAINKQKFEEAESGDIADAAYHFLVNLYGNFYRYSQKHDCDPRKDRLSIRTRILALSDEEFDAFIRDVACVFNRYGDKEPNGDRKMRSVSFISAPAEDS